MPAKILLVDPDPENKTYATELAHDGYEVHIADTGREALPKIRILKPDLVITELALSHINGLDVIRAIKENPTTKNIKVMVFSSLADEELQDEAKALGALEFLPKSVYEPGLLTREVGKYLPITDL